jgi:hypothetical protein
MSQEPKNIERELAVYESEIVTDRDRASAAIVETDEHYAEATAFISNLSGKMKDLDKLRKFFVDPLNAQVKNINAMFKPQIEAREEVIKIVEGKMKVYFLKKDAARIAEEKRLQAIRDKANEKREEQGKAPIVEPVRQVEETQRTTTVGNAQATVKKVWTHRIVSIDALPDDVKKAIFAEAYNKGVIDTVIRKFVNAGVREMSGVEIFQDVQIAKR